MIGVTLHGLPSELESYKKEEHLTDDFLIPLLQRLGFSIVVNFHGASEFGKDIIFGEIDRFGRVVYHGLQAKYVPSISLSASDELIEDAKQAFNNPFTHPQTAEDMGTWEWGTWGQAFLFLGGATLGVPRFFDHSGYADIGTFPV
jgi:hypothetical protein